MSDRPIRLVRLARPPVCDRCLEREATTTTYFRLSAQRKDGSWVTASTKRCDLHPYQARQA